MSHNEVDLRHSSGFSLIEVMISVGLVSILALAVLSLNDMMNKSSITSNNFYQADSFRKQISNQLLNVNAWRNTLANNATFACIQNATDCGSIASGGAQADQNGPPVTTSFNVPAFANSDGPCTSPATPSGCKGGFNVYDSSGNAYYNQASSTSLGFNSNGSQCSNWTGTTSGKVVVGTAAASPCPFRLVLYWKPICPDTTGTTCVMPMVHVFGYTLYTPNSTDISHKVPFNPGNYGVNLVLSPTP